ncbi:benzoate/H(+) symporter BenE family transporter [Marinomonas ostreistagni]|uniref:benzoate/H(+) symporter BenE family transporter n=1 Tax=Marinomonas ostreistagni TaxID=359209 RepID=UPI00195286F7|nr:benzoate/H(+) symporter BenE family transporter [Marinomonas ostreistagni]MBM6550269.1 benzoate/H(+) symporter BenE family transporter [Marinomonas ostreistagni]
MRKILSDISLSAVVAGFVAVLIGFASSVAIVFQAADAAGADEAMKTSWIMALGLGMGATCFFLSWWYKAPVITAWSTPGAALLATSLTGASYAEAIAVFMFAGALALLTGITGLFDRLMRWIPLPIACAMLVGVLFNFGVAIFTSMESRPWLVLIMLATYLISKLIVPRYAVILVLVAGVVAVLGQPHASFAAIPLEIGAFEWVTPEWNTSLILGVGVPLFIVTLTSQNIPGVAVMRSSQYQTPVSNIISWTGVTTLLLAPFGGFAFNLAAITAAICSGDECHKDPSKRYIAGMSAGIFYWLAGIAGATMVAIFSVFPAEMIAALAGLALLGTIGANLKAAFEQESMREAALVTFLTTVSGVSFFGVASAFWGICFGVLVWLIQRNWRAA